MILVIALLVLGPERLPEIARQAGKAMAELRRMSSGFQAEMRDAMKVPATPSPAKPATPSSPPATPGAGAAPPSGNGSTPPTFVWNDLPAPTEPGDPPGPAS